MRFSTLAGPNVAAGLLLAGFSSPATAAENVVQDSCQPSSFMDVSGITEPVALDNEGNALLPRFTLTCDDTTVTFSGNGVPNYEYLDVTGDGIEAQKFVQVMPRHPEIARNETDLDRLGPIGVAVNGAMIFGPNEGPFGFYGPDYSGDPVFTNRMKSLSLAELDAGPPCDDKTLVAKKFCNGQSTGDVLMADLAHPRNVEFLSPNYRPVILDPCLGHTTPMSEYHYHALIEDCLRLENTTVRAPWDKNGFRGDGMTKVEEPQAKPSPVLGYARDGFPIYGPWGCKDLSCSQIILLKSGWRRAGARIDATEVADTPFHYAWAAYLYVNQDGDEYLDRCNGRIEPDGTYGYHATAGFPYVLGCFKGKLISSSQNTAHAINYH